MGLLSDDPDSYGRIPAATATRVGEAHARNAIRLAPNQADGYAALGLIAGVDDQAAIAALKRAIALDPSRADVRIWLAIRLGKIGQYDDALVLTRDAAAIEPLWPMPLMNLVVWFSVEGKPGDGRQVAEQYRARGGNEAEYYRLLFLANSRGTDLSSAIADAEKARALDPTLPDIRVGLMDLYHLVGLDKRANIDVPSERLARPFYTGDTTALDAQIRSSGVDLWKLPDSSIGFFRLAAMHDWTMLNRLYDERPVAPQQLCFHDLEAAQAVVPALRAAGRQADAQAVLSCLRSRLAIEARQKARSWWEYWGDFEYNQATLAALSGDAPAALHWLEQAVARGWLGRPYSSSVSDRPQFDAFRSDGRMAALQARIDGKIAQERAKVLAQRH